jgi:dCMP deaminase
MRPTFDKYFMKIASAVSERSSCLRAHCGVVLTEDNNILSTGYNGNARGTEDCCNIGKCAREGYLPNEGRSLCRASHGEQNTIINLARMGRGSSIGSTMYVYFKRIDDSKNSYNKPCDECMKTVINSGVKRIVNYTEDNYSKHLDISIIDGGKVNTERIY